jgi:hypothetical protein
VVARAEGKHENIFAFLRDEVEGAISNVFEGSASSPGLVLPATQPFQIGTSPPLNTLLFQNSPRQLATDKVVFSLGG